MALQDVGALLCAKDLRQEPLQPDDRRTFDIAAIGSMSIWPGRCNDWATSSEGYRIAVVFRIHEASSDAKENMEPLCAQMAAGLYDELIYGTLKLAFAAEFETGENQELGTLDAVYNPEDLEPIPKRRFAWKPWRRTCPRTCRTC